MFVARAHATPRRDSAALLPAQTHRSAAARCDPELAEEIEHIPEMALLRNLSAFDLGHCAHLQANRSIRSRYVASSGHRQRPAVGPRHDESLGHPVSFAEAQFLCEPDVRERGNVRLCIFAVWVPTLLGLRNSYGVDNEGFRVVFVKSLPVPGIQRLDGFADYA